MFCKGPILAVWVSFLHLYCSVSGVPLNNIQISNQDTPPSAPYGNSPQVLSTNVDLKYFNKLNRKLGKTWNEGGQTISFNGYEITLEDDKTFEPDMKTIFFVHGFTSSASKPNNCENWVKNYKTAGKDIQVICVNWENLANVYNGYVVGAKNSVDVGWWLGRLLQSLVKKIGLDIDKVHLIGHSLGAHAAGMMGRTFTSLSGKQVARVTGLDPAGILFVYDTYGLKKHRIGRDSAVFVDIIHGNGNFNPYFWSIWDSSRYLGDLHALGHADFYPNGGMVQFTSGCKPGAVFGKNCSHNRPILYYLKSILGEHDPDGTSAYPAYECDSALTCSQGKTINKTVANNMGEFAKPPEGAHKQYYLSITRKDN